VLPKKKKKNKNEKDGEITLPVLYKKVQKHFLQVH
jgi:hypothetical protein